MTNGEPPTDFKRARRQRAQLIDPNKVELPPHSIEGEQGVLGCCLLSPQDCIAHVIEAFPPEAFYDLRHRTIYETLVAMSDRREAIDLITIQQWLKDRQQLEGVGGLAYLAGLPDSVPSAANLDYYITIVAEKFTIRQLGADSIEAVNQLREFPDKADMVLANLETTIGQLRQRLPGARESALTARLFNVSAVIERPEAVYSVVGVPVSTPGNLTAVSAQVKTGKTAFITAMQAAPMATEAGLDMLGVTSSNPKGLALLNFDTEQSLYDHHELAMRTLARARLTEPPRWFRSYCLTGFTVPELQRALHVAMDRASQEHGGIHSVFLDGVADMVRDVNDAEESNDFVGRLHADAIKYHCAIVAVIHVNPNSDKTRGHLGSQLERKAESNLRLEKEGEVSEVWSSKNRRAGIAKGFGPRFAWSDTERMHVSVESGLSAKRKLATTEAVIQRDEVFDGRPSMRWAELTTTAKKALAVSERTAARRVTEWCQLGIIEKSVAGLWIPRR